MNWKQSFTLGLLAPGVWEGEGEAHTVSGVWVFNSGTLSFRDGDSNLYFAEDETHSISFVSASVEYTSMQFRTANHQGFSWVMLYGDLDVYDQFEDFHDTAHQTVDFGTTPQTVSENFYNWLVANATKQE